MKIVKYIFACLLAVQAMYVSAQVNEYGELSEIEVKLAQRVNERFAEHNLPVLPVSKSLIATARWNAWDLMINNPINENCQIPSWSAAKPGKWTALCFTGTDDNLSALFNKPTQISGYDGGYSMNIGYIDSPVPSIDALLSKLDTMKFWESKYVRSFKTFGVSHYQNYLVIWFGDKGDARGYHALTSRLSNVTGLWFDSERLGSFFNFLTNPDGTTTIFFYGNTKKKGERLWLATDNIVLKANQPAVTNLYEVTGTTFVDPPKGKISVWGKLTITLSSCSGGRLVIEGKTGRAEYNSLKVLAVPDGANCY